MEAVEAVQVLREAAERQDVAAIDRLAAEFGGLVDREVRKAVNVALGAKAAVLRGAGRGEVALEVYDELLRRDEPYREAGRGLTLFQKAMALKELGRGREALAVFGEAFEVMAADCSGAWLEPWIARTFDQRAQLLVKLGQAPAAVQTYEELAQRFADTDDPELVWWFVHALNWKAITLQEQLGQRDRAIEAIDRVLARLDGVSEPGRVMIELGFALRNKAVNLVRLDRVDEAVEVYDELLGHFGDLGIPELRDSVVGALAAKIRLLSRLRRYDEARVVIRGITAQLQAQENVDMVVALVDVLLGATAERLAEPTPPEEELALMDAVIAVGRVAADPRLRQRAATTLLTKTALLRNLDRVDAAEQALDELLEDLAEDAIDGFDEAIRVHAGREETWRQVQYAAAIVDKASLLQQLGQTEKAAKALAPLLSGPEEPPPELAEIIALARQLELQLHNDTHEDM